MVNRRGASGDMLMIFTFFFLLVIIAVAVVAAVGIFYGKHYDFRPTEAQILNSKIQGCILSNSISDVKGNFYSTCGLSENIEKYDLSVLVCDGKGDCATKSKGDDGVLIYIGSNFQECEFSGTKGNENYPKCYEQSFEKGGQEITIITSSNQHVH